MGNLKSTTSLYEVAQMDIAGVLAQLDALISAAHILEESRDLVGDNGSGYAAIMWAAGAVSRLAKAMTEDAERYRPCSEDRMQEAHHE
ncbi:MAG: hypothetical protein KDH17_06845 [Rhodocyclaceae bacterium]|nr:hypothetical protein [Rhodocyclaceae bacterium]MCP5233639.1 hypothetical protein [Zoogloeaceae bacterium]